MKEKTKNIIIILLSIVVVLLIVLNVLALTDNLSLDNKNEDNNIKIDKKLDYIYEANYSYDNKYKEFYRGSYDDQNTTKTIDYYGISVEYTEGMQYLNNLKVPYININSTSATAANEEIKELYLKHAKLFDECAKEAKEESGPSCSQILTYRTYTYDDILSVVIIDSSQGTSTWVLEYNIYNFDLKTGNLLNYNELLSKLEYDKETTLSKIEQNLKNKIDDLYSDVVGDMSKACRETINDNGDYKEVSCYTKANELLEKSINDNSVLFFVNDQGNLNVLAIAYYDGVQNGEIDRYLIEIDNKNKNNEYADWMNYILKSDIQKINLERNIAAIKTNEEDYNKIITLEEKDLKQIFSKINNNSLIKKYSLGMGGDGDTLTISYKNNNNNYKLTIRNEYIFVEDTKDNDLITLFENSTYTIENEEIKDQKDSFYVFKYSSNDNIFDSYFE